MVMTTATIFGTGNMGSAIASIFSTAGVGVEYIDSSSGATTVRGDIVVLAVPYTAFGSIVAEYGDQFAGKIVVDISNPIDFTTFQLAVPADSSAATELAQALPDSKVVKAFNTTFAATLISRRVGANPTTVLIAGDDADTKASLSGIITSGGVGVVDAGDLTSARELEAVGFLQLKLAVGEKISFTGGFSVTE